MNNQAPRTNHNFTSVDILGIIKPIIEIVAIILITLQSLLGTKIIMGVLFIAFLLAIILFLFRNKMQKSVKYFAFIIFGLFVFIALIVVYFYPPKEVHFVDDFKIKNYNWCYLNKTNSDSCTCNYNSAEQHLEIASLFAKNGGNYGECSAEIEELDSTLSKMTTRDFSIKVESIFINENDNETQRNADFGFIVHVREKNKNLMYYFVFRANGQANAYEYNNRKNRTNPKNLSPIKSNEKIIQQVDFKDNVLEYSVNGDKIGTLNIQGRCEKVVLLVTGNSKINFKKVELSRIKEYW